MKIITRQACCHIILSVLLFGGCARPPAVPEEPAAQDVAADQVAPADALAIVHFDDQNHGFTIHEPSGEIEPVTLDKYNQAVQALKNEQLAIAIELFQEVIDSYPDFVNPHINIALAYRQLEMDKEAQDHLLAALALIPNHPLASNEYALLKKSQGDFKGARTIFEQAIADYPEYVPLHRNLGILCDVYFNDQVCAQEQFEACQQLIGDNNNELSMWLTELKLRSHE